ncbi:alpha-D-ribose 1-methylphosphonate 5-triphosphate synthase subunit PhnH [Roseinatronobacter thiooxidans]|uniref:Alpha-D-ribose 1-methylphosphonate 5-triphosphate synthase subunit PhnH n=1 Tax=Roseinatronobacter thiooxidans TaxID=121821 RepID=A0A2W7PW26_9RHOB|nr:phosphonate C-P lyase system protein PhnH [Roseinatronobacter thiooxidans]PZX38010.1 alpha-D-ribose 1-methylphosphonate 5-triphosphate synthase subunit PhnH [Roseinatronobacter thiooxidans]
MNAPLTTGFADPARDAARAFRQVLDAMAHPGRIVTLTGALAPAPCSDAAAIALMVLADSTTPLHLAGAHDCAALRDWVAFHLGAPLCGAQEAVFALGAWEALAPLSRYPQGVPDYPDRSATLIVECPELRNDGVRLTGPGIEKDAWLNLPDAVALQANAARFPLGCDLLLTCGPSLAALPRSTRLEVC